METLQGTIFIEFDVNTKKITFLRGDGIVDYDSNATSVYVRVKYKNLSGNTVYLTPSELEDYKFSLYTIKPATNNVNVIKGEVTDELKENVYGGVVKFEIPRVCTNRLGIVKCEIHINQGNKMIASSTFVLDVKQSLVTVFNDELLGDEDFPVLKQLILEIQKASNINDSAASSVTTYSGNKIENIKEDLNSQIKDKASKQELEVERKRIDNLATLSEGSTTGDAELIDARIGADGVTYANAGSAIRAIGRGEAIKDNAISDSKVKYATDFLVDCHDKDLVLNFNRTTKEVEVQINANDSIAYGMNGYWRHYRDGVNGSTGIANIPFPRKANTYMLVGRTCKDGVRSSLQFVQCERLQGGDFVFATIYFYDNGGIINISTTCVNPHTVTLDGQSIIGIINDGTISDRNSYSGKYLNTHLGGSQYALGSYIKFNYNTSEKKIEINHGDLDIIFCGKGYKKCTNTSTTSIDFSKISDGAYCLLMREDGSIQQLGMEKVLISDIIICVIHWNGSQIVNLYTAINNPQEVITINGVPSYDRLYNYDISHQFSNRHVWGIGQGAKINFNTSTKQIEFNYPSSVSYINMFSDVGYAQIPLSKLNPIPFPNSEWTYMLVAKMKWYNTNQVNSIELVRQEDVEYTDLIIATIYFSSSGAIYERFSGIRHVEQITVDGKPFNVNSYGIVNNGKSTEYTTYSSAKIDSLLAPTNKPYRFALKSTFTINFNTTTKQVEFKNVPPQAILFDNLKYWMKSASSNNTIEPVEFPSGGATFVLVAQEGNAKMQFKQLQETNYTDIAICTVYMVDKNIIQMTSSLVNFENLTIDDSPYMVHPAINDSKVSSKTTYSSEKINSLIGNSEVNYAICSDVYVVDELPLYKDSILDGINNQVSMYLAQGDKVTPFDKVANITNSTGTAKLGIIQNNTDTQKTITIHSVQSNANNGKSIKYQALGDSLTNRGVANYTSRKLSEYGVTTTCIGTMNNSGYKGEGREGWTYSNYVGRNNKFLNDGLAITPLTSKADGSLKTNPFIRLATDTDKANHPDWCFRNTGAKWELSYSEDTDKTGDFYIFDYANYLSVQGLDTPDIITIGLSTNDISTHGSSKDIVSCTEGLNIMIQQIKSALPNVKIGIIPTPVCRVHPDNVNRRKRDILWANSCMTQVSDLKSTYDNLYIVPVWMHMSRYGIYQDSDIIHWGSVGYYQYKNVVASWIMNII